MCFKSDGNELHTDIDIALFRQLYNMIYVFHVNEF